MTEFKPMLAKDGDLEKLSFPVFVQPKLDGIRASVVNGKLVSRTLKAIPNAEIREALERPEFEGLDGELIVGPVVALDCYRRTASFVMSESKTGEAWAYFVFDVWNSGAKPFTGRKAELDDFHSTLDLMSRIKNVATTRCDSLEQLERMEAIIVGLGHEGVIVRTDSPYKFGRSGKTGPLLKVKRFIDFEAEVVGVFEEQHNGNERVVNALGRGERSTAKAGKTGKGTLGGLIVRALNGPAEGVEFRVGTGFTADMRHTLWQLAMEDVGDSIINPGPDANAGGMTGWVAKVKSFPIGVKDKPRHPVFLGWRDMEVDG